MNQVQQPVLVLPDQHIGDPVVPYDNENDKNYKKYIILLILHDIMSA